MLEFATNANEEMMQSFYNSQDSISMTTCIRYANEQHSLIIKALENKEGIKNVKAISQHVVDDELMNYYDKLNKLIKTPDGEFHFS